MRAFVVELLEEAIEARLLLQKVLSCGFGGFFLERQVHAFMTPVLLRSARLDPFESDPEA